MGEKKIHDYGRGESWSVCEWILGLCSTEEHKELDGCLHVTRAAIVFCKSVLVFKSKTTQFGIRKNVVRLVRRMGQSPRLKRLLSFLSNRWKVHLPCSRYDDFWKNMGKLVN